MSYLLSKSRKDHPEKNGEVQKSPQNSKLGVRWFWNVPSTRRARTNFDTENTETCFVLVAGKATIVTSQATFEHIGNRASPFERIPPYSVYVPHQQKYKSKLKVI